MNLLPFVYVIQFLGCFRRVRFTFRQIHEMWIDKFVHSRWLVVGRQSSICGHNRILASSLHAQPRGSYPSFERTAWAKMMRTRVNLKQLPLIWTTWCRPEMIRGGFPLCNRPFQILTRSWSFASRLSHQSDSNNRWAFKKFVKNIGLASFRSDFSSQRSELECDGHRSIYGGKFSSAIEFRSIWFSLNLRTI
jgi:hypothetical protein